ncbi:MAG: alkylation response protein AidB-like acyl-CoA dehydrogenase [Halioglobus sp.]|jgi:alkylation response protein AidB-like acyl-CoA dehydrogenase
MIAMSVIGNTKVRFSEEQGMILDSAREFCRDKSSVSAVRAQLNTATGYEQSVWDEIVSLGWLGITLPETYGGSQLGVAGVVPVVEAMGRGLLGTPLISTTLAAQLILRAANSEQAERLLPGIAEGTTATIAVLENGDWGGTSIGCSIDDQGVLSGTKKFVADGSVAQLFVVSVLHDNVPALAIVNKDQLSDNKLTQNTLIDETKRAATVDFSGITVQANNLITGDAVVRALRDCHLIGALLVAAEATGAAAACLDTVVEYLKTRKQFGNLIGSYQALKHPAVDILTSMDSARSFVYHAATMVTDEALDSDAQSACRMAKVQATDALIFAGDRAVQFHGGMGFTYECDAQLYIRRAQWAQQQFGDAQHHRKHLAKLLLD